MSARSINGRVIPSNAARAVERFRPGGPIGYVSALGGPIRATRAEAEADWLYTIEGRHPMSHLLTVSKSGDEPDDWTYWTFSIECMSPGECAGWTECLEPHVIDGASAGGPYECSGCDDGSTAHVPWCDSEEFEFHGEMHTWQSWYGWCIPFVGCIVAESNYYESAWGIATEHGPGVYVVDTDWDDGDLTLLHVRSVR